MIRARASAMVHTARLEFRTRRVRQRERDALASAGESLATRERCSAGDAGPALLGEIQRLRLQLQAHSASLAGSLDADRADYVAVANWMRPLVVFRGLCARAVLRHQVVRARRELLPLYERLGAAALAEPNGVPGDLQVPSRLTEAVRDARAELASVVAERTRCLAPFDGKPCPAWIGGLADEGKAFGRALIKQMHGQLLPRASALAGLAAGWWVTHTYTDSRPRSLLRSLGIGSGGTHVVSTDTYQSMRFWLPILAAAISAYLGDRVARWVQQRYEAREVTVRST